MQALKSISRIATTALLLVLLLLCENAASAAGTKRLTAGNAGHSFAQRRKTPSGEAVLQSALSGFQTSFRRGDDSPPRAHGNPGGAEMLPQWFAVQAMRTGFPSETWPIPALADFDPVQVKLLFPKHWFW